MKNVFKATLFAASLFVMGQAHAQTKKDESFGHKVDRTATKVGHKTAEVAVHGTAAVVDKRYGGKYGPHGEDIYINKSSHYYYVDKRGHKVYLTKAHLHNKPMR